ncbi:adhesion G-protein coupled receptor G6-like [Dendronephthya gigantea]|uniref:adhesion G-protein coupled receptor G6-like n=1 Tax=Dendronephthya gigantea TaxID=151771 RepID=UPI00106CF2BB|nr:adhesion G-protein coupled receptor G6-like [Dendronephthya gigantea]
MKDRNEWKVFAAGKSRSLRLQGPSNGTGRIEVLHNGQWGAICDDGWHINNSRVACRQLGYPDAVGAIPGGQVPYGAVIWLSQVACTGTESSLTDCSHEGWGSGNTSCSNLKVAMVECQTTAMTASLRLKGPLSENGTGRVEVFYNGTWGTICDDGWDINDARVACRQLGYEEAVRPLNANAWQVPSGSGNIWLGHVDCTGKEESLANCSHAGWDHNVYCNHLEDAGVECRTVSCPNMEDGSHEAYGVFRWPETSVGSFATLACPNNRKSFATRKCLHTNQTENGCAWGQVMADQCKFREKRSKDLFLLAQEDVDTANVLKVSRDLKNLSDHNPRTSAGDINNIATILEKIAAVKEKMNETFEDSLTTIDNVLDASVEEISKSQQKNTSSRIVETLNNIAKEIPIGPGRKFEKIKRNYGLNLQEIQPKDFTGLTFSGVVKRPGEAHPKNTSISTNFSDFVSSITSASLIIPRTLFKEANVTKNFIKQRVIFFLFIETKFFRTISSDTKETQSSLDSFVIAGSIKGTPVANLKEPVKLVFPSISQKTGNKKSALCSFWDFSLENWSQEGCWLERVLDKGRVLCNCNHMTNFAVLMDMTATTNTPTHHKILGVVSYVGCALSLVGLIITIIATLRARERRKKVPNKILLNFCIALTLMIFVFMVAAEKAKSTLYGCRAAAIALHYFLLATFLWMGVEALNMYLAFVKIFPSSSQSKFMLRYCLFAWGTPVVIVAITTIVAFDKYGDTKSCCRLLGVPFIVAFVTPAVVVFVGNIVAFCAIIRSILGSFNHKTTGYHKARRGIAITVLLGLTWPFGFLAIGDFKLAFQYLFCILNTLQGLFIFVFFILLPFGTNGKLRITPKNTNTQRSDTQIKLLVRKQKPPTAGTDNSYEEKHKN